VIKLPSALAEPRQPLRAIAVGWLLACPPSLLLAVLAQWLLPGVERPSFEVTGLGTVALLVVFSPVVETLIMAAVLEVLLRFLPPAVCILLSSIGWGLAHSWVAPAWGLVIWWPFLIFSTLYVTWSKRSIWAGVGVVSGVHALQNLGPALLLLFKGSP
jgi:hypothetical protein